MPRLSVSEIVSVIGSYENLLSQMERFLYTPPRSRCSMSWRGKALGGSPKFLMKGATFYGVDARELLWCITFGRDRLPEYGWLYRLCDKPRCMDMEHVFVGPPGLSRTLGRMKKDGFPAGLFVLNGMWQPDPELLAEYRRIVRNRRAVSSRQRVVLPRVPKARA